MNEETPGPRERVRSTPLGTKIALVSLGLVGFLIFVGPRIQGAVRSREWIEYRDPNGRWLVSFPDTPMRTENGLGVVWGLVDGSTYMSVSSHELEGEEWTPDAQERLARGERVVRARIAGNLTATDTAIQGVPIRELEGQGSGFKLNGVTRTDHYLRCRIFVVGHRRFTILGEVPFDQPERRAEVARFLDSFRLLASK